MTKYLVTYHAGGPPPTDPDALNKMKTAFGAWLTEAGSAVVDPGAPVSAVAQIAKATPAPQIEIGGYSIVQGPSLDAVRAVLAKHPFVARGGTLQVSEMRG
jgi:hypothetical protein